MRASRIVSLSSPRRNHNTSTLVDSVKEFDPLSYHILGLFYSLFNGRVVITLKMARQCERFKKSPGDKVCIEY